MLIMNSVELSFSVNLVFINESQLLMQGGFYTINMNFY
jgi:hypothetical protein